MNNLFTEPFLSIINVCKNNYNFYLFTLYTKNLNKNKKNSFKKYSIIAWNNFIFFFGYKFFQTYIQAKLNL